MWNQMKWIALKYHAKNESNKKTINRNHVLLQNTVSLMCHQTQRAKTKTNNRNRTTFSMLIKMPRFLWLCRLIHFLLLLWRYIFPLAMRRRSQTICAYSMSAIYDLSKLAISHRASHHFDEANKLISKAKLSATSARKWRRKFIT